MRYFVREPLVSVVIVNFDYGRYVADAIQSVKDQSYRNFECLIIDNGSTDNSCNVVAAAIADDPQFTLYRLPRNLGHLGGGLYALDRLKGDFVTFLDADDVLFPDYLASHLQVHLSGANSTAFTSSNAIEVNAEGMQLSAGYCTAHYVWLNRGVPSLRPFGHSVQLAAFSERAYTALADVTRYIEPDTEQWIWCSGSANMFRRSLLERVRPNTPPETPIFGGVDGYFLPVLHAISGSNLIDRPLSAYRLHGRNDYTTLPSIVHARIGTERVEQQSYRVLSLILVNIIEGFRTFPVTRQRFWRVLELVANTESQMKPLQQPDVRAAFARTYPELCKYFGETVVISELRRWYVFRDLLAIVGGPGQQRARRSQSIFQALTIASRQKLQRTLQRVTG